MPLAIRTLLAALAAATVLAPAGAAAAPRSDVTPQVVLDWSATALATVLAEKPQPQSAVYLGLVHAAMYDAVVAVEGGFEPYLIVPGVPPGSSPEAAAAAAAHGVLVAFFPAQKQALDAAYADSLTGIPDGPGEERGVLVGEQVARGIVAARIDDGRDAPFAFEPVPVPGVWRPTPPAFLPAVHPWLGAMTPLLLERASQFRPGPPPPLTSRRYARDYEETRLYGALTGSRRTAAQTETALFWTDSPAAQYNRALHRLVTARGLDLAHAARALALSHAAVADAVIACWDVKNAYAAWRPVTAIHEAATDGNAGTKADPDWQPLRPTPNQPEYPSAGTCANAAFGEAVAEIVGSRRIGLEIDSAQTGTTRRYERLQDLERESVDARVFIGYHWRTSNEVGYRLGERVARWALRRNFERTN